MVDKEKVTRQIKTGTVRLSGTFFGFGANIVSEMVVQRGPMPEHRFALVALDHLVLCNTLGQYHLELVPHSPFSS